MSNEGRKAHLVGSGIGNLAAAAYLIKDGGFPRVSNDIHVVWNAAKTFMQ